MYVGAFFLLSELLETGGGWGALLKLERKREREKEECKGAPRPPLAFVGRVFVTIFFHSFDPLMMFGRSVPLGYEDWVPFRCTLRPAQ